MIEDAEGVSLGSPPEGGSSQEGNRKRVTSAQVGPSQISGGRLTGRLVSREFTPPTRLEGSKRLSVTGPSYGGCTDASP